jgi:tetrahydromethanopterin S-methyltransferase subunit G
VPEKPKKILTEPDDFAYHMKVAQIDEKIEVLKAEISEERGKMVQERSDMIDG